MVRKNCVKLASLKREEIDFQNGDNMINFVGRNNFIETAIRKFLFCEDDNLTVYMQPQSAKQYNVARMWINHKDGTRDLARDEDGNLMLQFRYPQDLLRDSDDPLFLHECVHLRQFRLGRLSSTGMGDVEGVVMPVKFDGKTFYRGNQYYKLIEKYRFSWKTWKDNKNFWADLRQYYPWEFEAWSVEAAYRSGNAVDYAAIGRKQPLAIAA